MVAGAEVENGTVDDGVDFEVDGQAEPEAAGCVAAPPVQVQRHQDEQRHQRFGVAPRRNDARDGIEEPQAAANQRPPFAGHRQHLGHHRRRKEIKLITAVLRTGSRLGVRRYLAVDDGAVEDVDEAEEQLSKARIDDDVGRQQPGQQRRIAVRRPLVRRAALHHETRRVREHLASRAPSSITQDNNISTKVPKLDPLGSDPMAFTVGTPTRY